jgi:hypothetical protein
MKAVKKVKASTKPAVSNLQLYETSTKLAVRSAFARKPSKVYCSK